MKKYIVKGGNPLSGMITVEGMKNSALPILYATIVAPGKHLLRNIPDISDIRITFEILRSLGAIAERLPNGDVCVDTAPMKSLTPPPELTTKLRGSSYLYGAMLSRFGFSNMNLPGGCNFADRPMDIHFKGFTEMGANRRTSEVNGQILLDASGGLHGVDFFLDFPSVGATVNLILAAVRCNGTTVLRNCAKEPHIVDLANFLNACGAKIFGAGSSVIRIRGVKELHPCEYTILPDTIVAGTYLLMAAAVGGEVTVAGLLPEHLDTTVSKLREAGVGLTVCDDSIRVLSDGSYRAVSIQSLPWPGIPTDLQPQFAAFSGVAATGIGTVRESVFKGRLQYTAELAKMGIEFSPGNTNDSISIYAKRNELHGASVAGGDLRATAALLIAALAANGTTELGGIEFLERGYEDIVGKLRAIGADITVEETTE